MSLFGDAVEFSPLVYSRTTLGSSRLTVHYFKQPGPAVRASSFNGVAGGSSSDLTLNRLNLFHLHLHGSRNSSTKCCYLIYSWEVNAAE